MMILTACHDADAFERWLQTAQPGEWAEYHRGVTAQELVTNKVYQRLPSAQLAWDHAMAGVVVLAQRRLGKGQYAYLAQRRLSERMAVRRRRAAA